MSRSARLRVAAVGANPFAGAHGDDLSEMIAWGSGLGTLLGKYAAEMLGAPVLSYGKAAIVGLAGEQEHGVALLTTAFGDALRDAVGGGLAWISSATKRGGPGTVIDVPPRTRTRSMSAIITTPSRCESRMRRCPTRSW